MNAQGNFDEVMKDLDEINDMLESAIQEERDEEDHRDNYLRMEYAFESLTERHSIYKKRTHNA